MKLVNLDRCLFGLPVGKKYLKNNSDLETIERSIPNSLDEKSLKLYLLHWSMKDKPVTLAQFEALVELLLKAESFGHDLNTMMTVATASGWSRVVFDNHLKPNEKTSF